MRDQTRRKMNRLVIIGNGFDLAHGMKTSYHDFIFSYIKTIFKIAEEEGRYEDALGSVVKTHYWRGPITQHFTKLEDFIGLLPLDYAFTFLDDAPRRETYDPLLWKIADPFITYLFTKCQHCGWVDIENEYYSELKKILNIEDAQLKSEKVRQLNEAFASLRNALEIYLSTVTPKDKNTRFRDFIDDAIHPKDVVKPVLSEWLSVNDCMILNFNYTDTVTEYIDELNKNRNSPIVVNYIHGELNSEINPIIFGFGDEMDKEYSKLEDEPIKGFLNYMKSFGYFKNSNYRDLIRFINSEIFQVITIGHSCGLSDRTMLNMVFEHDNCRSIKIYYYEYSEGNNYVDLTQEVSRHFKSKQKMRERIVPFESSLPMPHV
ncbi:AbiH family protein [Chitinophagaceae bacterium 26-R-25]|nr:AbiH family protein [Chitinophagaceae bacterium 26-R-25]